MADEKIDLLENQIEKLEKRIFGNADKDSAYPKVVDTLAGLKHQLAAALVKSHKAEPVMKRIGELNNYLDPSYGELITQSRDAKTDIILAEEEFLRQTAANLEKVKDMADVLGSEHIKVIPGLEDKLQQLSKIHLEQQDSICELTEETKALLLQYNNSITLLSKQFVQWDELLTKLEISRRPQKTYD